MNEEESVRDDIVYCIKYIDDRRISIVVNNFEILVQ